MNFPAAIDALLAVLVCALCSFGLFRAHARHASKKSPKQTIRRIRRAFKVGLVLTAIVTLFVALVFDAPGTTEAAIRAVSPLLADSPVGVVLAWVPTFVAITVAVVSGYLGAFPYVREIRDVDVSAVDAAKRLTRFVTVFFVLFVPMMGAIIYAPDDLLSGTLPAMGFLVVLSVVMLALQPTLVSVSRSVREPTEEERARLDRLAEEAGLSHHGTTIIEMDGDRMATVVLLGLPTRRHLFATDHLLEQFDDEVVAGVLASKTGRANHYYREFKLVSLLAVSGFVIAIVTGELQSATGLDSLALLALTVLVVLLLFWLGRRFLFAADEYAAERVGAKSFADTLQTIADEQQVAYDRGRIVGLFKMAPSVGTRLDRLWQRAE